MQIVQYRQTKKSGSGELNNQYYTVMNIILQLPIIKVEMLNFKEIYNS